MGLMFFAHLKSLTVVAGILLFAIYDIFHQRSLGKKSDFESSLVYIFSGFIIVSIIFAVFFASKQALSDLIDFHVLFNLNSDGLQGWHKQNALSLTRRILLGDDYLLTATSIFSILMLDFKNDKSKLLFFLLAATTPLAFAGLYPQYTLIFLPLLSISVALFINKVFVEELVSGEWFSLKKFVFVIFLIFIFGTMSGNFLDINRVDDRYLVKQKEELQWVLENVSRDDKVSILRYGCPSFVFNKIPRFFWRIGSYESKVAKIDLEASLPELIATEDVKYFFASSNEVNSVEDSTAKFIRNNFTKVDTIFKDGCIWQRNK